MRLKRKLLARRGWPGWALYLEWKPQDLWIGAFWKRVTQDDPAVGFLNYFDLWVCVVPCLPIHFTRWW